MVNNSILAEEYAASKGISEEEVINQIREGKLIGFIKENVWYVEQRINVDNKFSDNLFQDSEMPVSLNIGGWLILPAIGMVLGPIATVLSIAIVFGMGDLVDAGDLGFEIILDIAMLVFQIYVAIIFFAKKKSVPNMVIALILVSLGVRVMNLMMSQGDPIFIKPVISGVIGALIWVPYFRVSERVKNTFVN